MVGSRRETAVRRRLRALARLSHDPNPNSQREAETRRHEPDDGSRPELVCDRVDESSAARVNGVMGTPSHPQAPPVRLRRQRRRQTGHAFSIEYGTSRHRLGPTQGLCRAGSSPALSRELGTVAPVWRESESSGVRSVRPGYSRLSPAVSNSNRAPPSRPSVTVTSQP